MDPIARQVARRYASRLLKLGPGRLQEQPTAVLRRTEKLHSRSRGDLQGAVISAGYHAKKQDKAMFVYAGSSYMHTVWRVSSKPSEYLDPINNTGTVVFSVTPDLEVTAHEVIRAD